MSCSVCLGDLCMLIATVISLAWFRFQIAQLNLDAFRHVIVVWFPLIGLWRVISFSCGWSAELYWGWTSMAVWPPNFTEFHPCCQHPPVMELFSKAPEEEFKTSLLLYLRGN